MFQLKIRTSKPCGFALIVALVLMSFMFLLLVSLSSLLQVEYQSSTLLQSHEQAKSNALLGMQMALGRIQSELGPDGRATARSDVADENALAPYMVGVYKTINEEISASDPATYLQSLRDWSLTSNDVTWLVSSSDRLNDPVSQTIESLNDEVVIVQTDGQPKEQVDRIEIKAGKIPVSTERGETGAFAWWVDDESQKAKFNIVAPETIHNKSDFKERWALTPAQQTTLTVDGIEGYEPEDPDDKIEIGSISGLDHADMLYQVNSEEDWFQRNFLHLTTHSSGLPVDVTQGRLKQDLSVYLTEGATSSSDYGSIDDSTPIIRGHTSDNSDGYIGPQFSDLNYSAQDMPRFGLIRSWKETGESVSGFSTGGVESQPHTNEQHGIHPVILRAGMYLAPYFRTSTNPAVDDIAIELAAFPRITLWNPTTVPITDKWFLYQVGMTTQFQFYYDPSNLKAGAAISDSGVVYTEQKHGFYNLNMILATQHNHRIGDEMRVSTFALRLDTPLLPGQTRTFYPDSKGQTLRAYRDDKSPGSPKFNGITESNINSANVMSATPLTENYFVFKGITSKTLNPVNNGTTPVTTPQYLESYLYINDGKVGSAIPKLSGCAYRLFKVNTSSNPTLLTEFYVAREQGTSENDVPPYAWSNSVHYDDPADNVVAEGVSLVRIQSEDNLDIDVSARRGHQIYLTHGLEDPETDHNSIYRDESKQFSLFANYNSRSRHIFPGTYETNELGAGNGEFNPNNEGRRQEIYSEGRPEAAWITTNWPVEDYDSVENGYGDNDFGSPGLFDIESSNNGLVYTLFDYPRLEDGVLSLGDLQSVNFATYAWQPGNAFGNSRADSRIKRERIYTDVNTSDDSQYISDLGLGDNRYIDLSWLLNYSLWDRFFISTIPYDDNNFSIGPGEKLRSARYVIADDSASNEIAGYNSDDALNNAARDMHIDGVFNVNSTSVVAWKQFLSANYNKNLSVENTATGTQSYVDSQVAFPRLLYPYRSEPGSSDLDVDNETGARAAFSANRSLSDNELNVLAEKIVDEVRQRAPFLSVADFINRRLVADSDNVYGAWGGLSGVLQTAIDRVTVEDSLINAHLYADKDLLFDRGDVPSYLEQDHVVGLPPGREQTRLAGAPGSLTQADILRSLGAYLTVRGDTFRIRAYGEAKNPITQEATAKVWCEAIVQRIASPVDSDDDIVAPDEATYPFGRKFRVVAFKWLDADDV